jgi:type 1 glutamine amidotransferase
LAADGKTEEAKAKSKAAEAKSKAAKDLKSQVEGRKPGIHRADDDHALAWTREYGKGRVFYTALGHRDDVWKDERYQKLMIGGLRYVLRLEDADATPSGPLSPK